MAVPTKEEIKAALAAYLEKKLKEGVIIDCAYDEATGSYLLKDQNQKEVIIGPGLKCTDDAVCTKLREIITDAREAAKGHQNEDLPNQIKSIVPRERKPKVEPLVRSGGNMVMPIRDIQVQELTIEDIKNYICPDASDADLAMFLKLCQARNLNPFLKEAYLIPYKDKEGHVKASMVVGKDAFMRKAEQNPQYDGFKAGIIVSKGDEIEYRQGTFLRPSETLEGGWAEVYRKDRKEPIRAEVSLKEYDSGRSLWLTKKATMIRKVPIVQAHREAFPTDLGACYDESEISVDPSKEIRGG
jgi:phage recombination protein Bet